MARVKRAVNAHKKRRTTLERASGYRGQRSRLYRKAKEQVTHSLVYSYRDRKARKGDFRKLWIQRINAAARANGMTYNRFIQGLHLAGVERGLHRVAPLSEEEPPLGSLRATAQPTQFLDAGVARGERVDAQAETLGALTSSGRAALATSTSATNAGASLTARSARILRSTSTPAALRPWMKRL